MRTFRGKRETDRYSKEKRRRRRKDPKEESTLGKKEDIQID